MAPRSRRRLFEELGLLGETEEANPYTALGLDPSFAGELLKEDTSGEALQGVAKALYRVLSKRYHPDVPETANTVRFREITEASISIENAELPALNRWSKVEKAAAGGSTAQNNKLRAEREALTEQAAALLQTNLELGNHPQHFSQLWSTQGVLLQRGVTPLLLRQRPGGGVRINKGQTSDAKQPVEQTQAFDFSRFLQKHKLFGLEPGSQVVAYLDGESRASILAPDLTFMMDITNPVAKYRAGRESLYSGRMHTHDYWSRATDPVVFITRVPERKGKDCPSTQTFTFPELVGPKNALQKTTWELPMEVAGTIADQRFFNRVRHAGSAALSSVAGRQTMRYFTLAAVSSREFIKNDSGYSPLLTGGERSLLLFDTTDNMPVVTDVSVIGMLGSDSKAG